MWKAAPIGFVLFFKLSTATIETSRFIRLFARLALKAIFELYQSGAPNVEHFR